MILTDEQVKEIQRRNNVERPTFYGATLENLTETAVALRAQLAESAAREVRLREALEAVRHDEIATRTGLSAKTGRLIDAIVAAPPSTAAAELVALRELEKVALKYRCARCEEQIPRRGDYHYGEDDERLVCRTPDLSDALAAVAAARAGTP